MGFLKNIFSKKEEPIKSYSDFWNWFAKHEKDFYQVVKTGNDIEEKFFNKLEPKLQELKDGYLYVTGMYDDNTVELVFTADGITKNIAFVEELVKEAPPIKGWKFTALKPALDISNVAIEMSSYSFNKENLNFYSNEKPEYPDEIDICITYDDFNEEDKSSITGGIYLFLDNYLGELDTVNNIDNITILSKKDATQELIPITKLKDFLNWRQKEFIEKYQATRYETNNDSYSLLEAKLDNGYILIASINTTLLNWDSKASHPWIAILIIKFDESQNNGLPSKQINDSLYKLEDEAIAKLIDSKGYLNVGRQTAQGEREIYFACKDFRLPSKVFYEVQQKYGDQFEIDYDIYKDKYWQSFKRFEPGL